MLFFVRIFQFTSELLCWDMCWICCCLKLGWQTFDYLQITRAAERQPFAATQWMASALLCESWDGAAQLTQLAKPYNSTSPSAGQLRNKAYNNVITALGTRDYLICPSEPLTIQIKVATPFIGCRLIESIGVGAGIDVAVARRREPLQIPSSSATSLFLAKHGGLCSWANSVARRNSKRYLLVFVSTLSRE